MVKHERKTRGKRLDHLEITLWIIVIFVVIIGGVLTVKSFSDTDFAGNAYKSLKTTAISSKYSIKKSLVLPKNIQKLSEKSSTSSEENEVDIDYGSVYPSNVFNNILNTCPTNKELKEFQQQFPITSDIPLKEYQCIDGKNPLYSSEADPRLNVYQMLRIMKSIKFTKYLPWTDKQLYDWFKGEINGFHLNKDTTMNYCCNPKGIINFKYDLLLTPDYYSWLEGSTGIGMMDLFVVTVHEARHAKIFHDCGPLDSTIDSLGAWGVQYYLHIFIADKLPVHYQSDQAREASKARALEIKNTRFCDVK